MWKPSVRTTAGFWPLSPTFPCVMAYGVTEIEAVRKVKAIALQVLAEIIESGEEVPEPLRVLFAA